MAKTLDFNKVNRPVLQLIMQDDDKTVIKVSTPTEGLIEELQATLPEVEKVMAAGDKAAIDCCYDLAARLINHNRSFVKVTANDLREKYKVDLESLILFYSAYFDFIQEITNAKN